MILIQSTIADSEREELLRLVETSTFDERQRDWYNMLIAFYKTTEEYNEAKQNLLANQLGIDGANNPSQGEINKHLRKITKVPV